jgi:hypothetical protein
MPPKKNTLAKPNPGSQRADAEEAIEADRKNPTPSMEQLMELLKGSVDEKTELVKENAALKGEITKIQTGMGDMFQIIKSLQEQVKNRPTLEGMQAPKLVTLEPMLQCETCRQFMKTGSGKGICDGEHVTIRVMPKMTMLWPRFQGIKRNGQNYFGYCRVPKSMMDDILANIGIWEQYQLNLKMPKKFSLGGDTDLSKLRGTQVPFMN